MRGSETDTPRDNGTGPSPELRREFWVLVVLFDIAVLGLGAGVMLVYFGVRPTLGWTAIIVGIAAFGYGYGRYRRRERNRVQNESGR